MNPGELLKAARNRNGLSQAVVAARSGTSQPVISAYERGGRDPTIGTLRKLISATGERLELRLAAPAGDLPPPATAEDHAERLVDVLLLADAIGHRGRMPLAFPHIDST